MYFVVYMSKCNFTLGARCREEGGEGGGRRGEEEGGASEGEPGGAQQEVGGAPDPEQEHGEGGPHAPTSGGRGYYDL